YSSFTSIYFFFFFPSGAHLHLPSFPTRRSSDLPGPFNGRGLCSVNIGWGSSRRLSLCGIVALVALLTATGASALTASPPSPGPRSEEHTSELQSQSNLVCRLLLEKKKQKRRTHK